MDESSHNSAEKNDLLERFLGMTEIELQHEVRQMVKDSPKLVEDAAMKDRVEQTLAKADRGALVDLAGKLTEERADWQGYLADTGKQKEKLKEEMEAEIASVEKQAGKLEGEIQEQSDTVEAIEKANNALSEL